MGIKGNLGRNTVDLDVESDLAAGPATGSQLIRNGSEGDSSNLKPFRVGWRKRKGGVHDNDIVVLSTGIG